MTSPKVPEKLSDLIALASKDMRDTVLTNPKYVVDMSTYYFVAKDTCYVCFAGAVLAGTLGLKDDSSGFDPHKDLYLPTGVYADWLAATHALDCVRRGCLGLAYERLFRISATPAINQIENNYGHKFEDAMRMTKYRGVQDRAAVEEFLTIMDELVKDLREAGL